MGKKIGCPVVLFILGLVLLSGCTSYMRGSMDLERKNYESAIDNFQQEL